MAEDPKHVKKLVMDEFDDLASWVSGDFEH